MAFGVIAKLAGGAILDKVLSGKDDDKPKGFGSLISNFGGGVGGGILSLLVGKLLGGENKDGPGEQPGS